MFNSQKSKAEGTSERQSLEAEIIEDVSAAVDEILEQVPPDWPRTVAHAIKDEVLGHTEFILKTLGLSDLRSESARAAHIFNAQRDARRWMNINARARK